MRLRAHRDFMRQERGAVAAEFALVIGVAIVAVLSVINAGLLFYSYTNLHMAAEDTARWAAIQETQGLSYDAQAQGETYYLGATATPTFAASTIACGVQVIASTSFTLILGFGTTPVAMNASSCYPLG
jgi:Flp pilus assembly protein TadG